MKESKKERRIGRKNRNILRRKKTGKRRWEIKLRFNLNARRPNFISIFTAVNFYPPKENASSSHNFRKKGKKMGSGPSDFFHFRSSTSCRTNCLSDQLQAGDLLCFFSPVITSIEFCKFYTLNVLRKICIAFLVIVAQQIYFRAFRRCMLLVHVIIRVF